jgi:hypothetical protein
MSAREYQHGIEDGFDVAYEIVKRHLRATSQANPTQIVEDLEAARTGMRERKVRDLLGEN